MGLPLRWKHWIGFTLLATTTSLLAYHLGSLAAAARRRQEQPVPLQVVNGLYIEPQSLDLGEVWESPRHTFPLTIENVGNVPRTISGFATTCGCLELDPEGQTIPPGGKVEFAAHLDLMNRLSYQTGVAQWDKTIRLDPVFVGDLQPTRGWEVKCTVRSRVSFNTTNLAFAERCFHDGPRAWRKVMAKAHVPLKSLHASALPKFADVRVESNTAIPDEYLVFVSPNPALPVGRFRFEVQIQAVTLDDEIHPCSTIVVVGEIQPASRVTPRMVLFGEHPTPSEPEAEVTLRLPANDWKIDHIETDTTDTLVKQGKTYSDGVRLHITQRIRQPGDGVSTIRIVVRKPDRQMEIVPVEIRYYGQSGPRP